MIADATANERKTGSFAVRFEMTEWYKGMP